MKRFLILIAAFMLLGGCNKFLDVNPINKAFEEDLFTDRPGFETALAGIYQSLSQQALFGLELKYGFMESLVGSYNITNASHKYYRASRFEYGYSDPRAILGRIWGELYQNINQSNIILTHIDNVHSSPHYNLIKGETLGLRAFAHFQLLKLFGPTIPQEGIDAMAIPYKSEVSFVAVKPISAAEVIALLHKDLAEARALLSEDPIRTNLRTADLNEFSYERYNSLIDYRGIRMNYYAIIALQALVAQWSGDLALAANYGEELLTELNQNEIVRLALAAELNWLSMQRMPIENIFALHANQMVAHVDKVFPTLNRSVTASTSTFLLPNYNWLSTNLYRHDLHGSANDYRLLNWFARPNSSFPWKLSKYIFDPNYQPTNNAHKPLFENKIISIHHIYMLVAEYYAEADPAKAIMYVNTVRRARDITADLTYTPNMTTQQVKDLIFDEVRKENIGEGMLFTEYKRLYKGIHRNRVVPPSVSIFRLPLPDDELMFNP